jgi:hypothetical protein
VDVKNVQKKNVLGVIHPPHYKIVLNVMKKNVINALQILYAYIVN